MATKLFTGRSRQRKTRPSVRWADFAARWVIACGGIGTIIAVLTVCVFLVAVVLPLFLPASATSLNDVPTVVAAAKAPLHFGVDEYQLLGAAVLPDGSLDVLRLDTGKVIDHRDFLAGQEFTAATFTVDGESAAFGMKNGTVRLARLGFNASFPDEAELPEKVKQIKSGQIVEHDGGVITRTPEGQLRLQTAVAELQEPIDLELKTPIRLVDYAGLSDGEMYCVLTEDNQLRLEIVTRRENMLTGETVNSVRHTTLPFKPRDGNDAPTYLLLSGQGDNVYLAWPDGELLRFDVRDFDNPVLAETLDLVPDLDRKLTVLSFMLGRNTLLAGDSTGRVRAWFRIKPDYAETSDGALLVAAHDLAGFGAAVTSLGPSARSRMVSIGYADGVTRVYFLTNQRLLVETKLRTESKIRAAGLAPKDDGLFALSDKELARWKFDPAYPEATLQSLFMPMWYEGYERPSYVWQSSGGTDDFEPKLGLIPLVFGTLKATFYSMLFGVPLALLAAVYTSEFLSPRTKAKVKPAIEMMASLPSVVLGFLAGIVIAPFVEGVVPEVLASFFTVPFALLLGAYLWQMLPQDWSVLLARYRLLFIALTLPLGIGLANIVGPWAERTLFGGDLLGWLANRQIGSGLGGWLILLLPLCAIAMAWFVTQQVNPFIRQYGSQWSRLQWAVIDLVRFLASTVAAILLALAVGWLLDALGWDPRGTFVDTYVQRNALVVGFVMGFAVIPIIYTIADDALSTVPAHLRSASLGAGATPWQTAVRIIIPTAMSGLFSAVMIGLGRAVGETMIVLMAAGNTSIMDLNIFNGFQTLSALIATELPEAVRNSTHYRTLFLAALALFVLTFIVNTAAELIRLRFRRRAYEL
jgi:phosphate transport system permease protein